MKKILIATALAGAIVGSFASLSFAAPLPARLDNGSSSAIVNVAEGCGPYGHRTHGFRDRYGHWIPGHCVRDFHRAPPPPGYYR
jgi:hypothetical protein